MNRIVLDTNIVVSALLVPTGVEAAVLLLALRSDITLCISTPIFQEYAEVLPAAIKFQPWLIATALEDIQQAAHVVVPTATLAVSSHESDNRFLKCVEVAAGLPCDREHPAFPENLQEDEGRYRAPVLRSNRNGLKTRDRQSFTATSPGLRHARLVPHVRRARHRRSHAGSSPRRCDWG